MSHPRTDRLIKVLIAFACLCVVAVMTVGCSDATTTENTSAVEASNTALGSYELARSALSTMAPDAKLLVVQTAESTTTTSTPVWVYLFGLPETDTTYVVYTMDGTVMSAGEYGTGGLSESEWASVPDASAWVIDSDEAYDSALEVSGATGTPTAYFMGFQTFVPESDTTVSDSEAFKWYVYFEPGASGATTATIEVDAQTGDTLVWAQ